MPPPGHKPFLRAICENPADDAPRLIYADWLDENGDAERAEFIRAQIANAKMEDLEAVYRCDDILMTHRGTWLGDMPRSRDIKYGRFSRGFLSAIEFGRPRAFFEHAAAIFETTPADDITIGRLEDVGLKRVLESNQLRNVRILTLPSFGAYQQQGIWRALAAASCLGNLTSLTVRLSLIQHGVLWRFEMDAESRRLLTKSPFLKRLEYFSPADGVVYPSSDVRLPESQPVAEGPRVWRLLRWAFSNKRSS